MRFPDNEATRLTELVMRVLRANEVLKHDEPNHPHHFNRAYSAVHAALTDDMGLNENSNTYNKTPLKDIIASNMARRGFKI